MKNLLQKSIAEFLGSFALVFFGCGAIAVNSIHHYLLPVYMIPVIFGMVVAVMIYALGHISGAHFNPAVTFAFAMAGRFGWKETLPYWLAQFLGMLLAMLFLVFLLPEAENIGVTIPNTGISQAVLWEFILTFFLMFVIISVATDSRAVGIMAGVAIGGIVTLDAFIGGSITGASMNPARSLAPAIISGQYQHLWIYFLSPCLGAAFAAFIYDKIRCDDSQEKIKNKGCC